ncbi:MAG: hypothetical protein WD944_08320 [Steroidobacteraceae bacterium]
MRHTAALLSIVAAVAVPAFGQDHEAEPTAFESFVSMPSVVVEFTQSIGTLSSTDATVEVSALVAYDTAQPGVSMRGVRLTMENNTSREYVYLDAGQLAAAKSELAEIESGVAELKSGSDAPYRVQGTARCWRPERPMRILCPSYRVGPDGAGLGLGVLGGSGFSFPGRRPSEFAALIDQATATLETLEHGPRSSNP